MLVTMLKEFIAHNELLFTEGRRNSDIVMLCGYALHLGVTKEVIKESLKPYSTEDAEVTVEFNKVYNYANYRNYGYWWKDAANKKAVDSWTPPAHKNKTI